MNGTTQDLIESGNSKIVRVAAVGVVNSVGQILVGFNKKRYVWDVPQGVVEDGELVHEAATRELLEETGLQIGNEGLESIALFSHKTPEFVYPWQTTLFLAHASDLSKANNMEPEKCDHLAWFSAVQLPYPRGLSLRVLLNLLGKD